MPHFTKIRCWLYALQSSMAGGVGAGRLLRRVPWPCAGARFGQQLCQWDCSAASGGNILPGGVSFPCNQRPLVKLFDRVLNPREIRRRLGLNQEQFWTQIGVTQSGGSRYESGREMPKPVRELLRLVHVEQVDLSQVKRVDFEIISYLKDSHPDLYRNLRRAARSKHKHPDGEPAVLGGEANVERQAEMVDDRD